MTIKKILGIALCVIVFISYSVFSIHATWDGDPLHINYHFVRDIGGVIRIITTDSLDYASRFNIANVMVHTRNGGTGHRETLHVEQNVYNANRGEMLAGAQFVGRILSGSGSVFGGGSWAEARKDADQSAEIVGHEFNTKAERDINRKVGIQIVDVEGSVGEGIIYDAGIFITKQNNSAGYRSGILFDHVHKEVSVASGDFDIEADAVMAEQYKSNSLPNNAAKLQGRNGHTVSFGWKWPAGTIIVYVDNIYVGELILRR